MPIQGIIKKIYLIGEPFLCNKIAAAFPNNCLPQNFSFFGIFSNKKLSDSFLPILNIREIRKHIDDSNSYFISVNKQEIVIPPKKQLNLIHPSTINYNSFIMGISNVIMPHCVFYQNVKIGSYCVFMNNTKAGHDVEIGENCFFDYYSFIGSYNTINENVVLGSKTTTKENVVIEKNSLVKPFSTVINNIPENQTWGGLPAKQLYK